jgi:uncharacterized protein YukE
MVSRDELRRQAGDKDLLAERFDGYAKDLATLFDRIKTGSVGGGPVWTGPAAQRFDHDAGQHRSDIERLVQQCHLAARNLRRAAQQLRQQAEQSAAPF